MSDVAKTPREELECEKKYLYEYSMFWECNDGSKCQILEYDVCDLLNKLYEENEQLKYDNFMFKGVIETFQKVAISERKKLENQVDEQQATIDKLDQQCADFLGARIKAQEEWEKCTDKLKEKIVEQQSTISQLEEKNEKLIQKNCIPCELVNLQTREIDKLKEENEKLRKQCFELEKDYVIETSDISDKIYLDDEINELKQKYGVTDE